MPKKRSGKTSKKKSHTKASKPRKPLRKKLHSKISKVRVSKPRKALRKKMHRKLSRPRKHVVSKKPEKRKKVEGRKKLPKQLQSRVPPSIEKQPPADFLKEIKSGIAESAASAAGLPAEEILPLLEKPPEGIDADFALPCFALARILKKDPRLIALDLYKKITPSGVIMEANNTGPYLNFSVDWNSVASGLIPSILQSGSKYGSSKTGEGKTVVVDFSAPNIAKPMSVGHMRSTIIGDSLCRIHRFLGYKVIGDNHLGDWGTQFGKIIVAYRKWGHPERLDKNPIEELLRIYVKFHEEAEIDKTLEDEARAAFKRLEDGDKESLSLWKKFTDLSLAEFGKVYKSLGVKFDAVLGESFYLAMAKEVIDEAIKKKVTKWSQHALIIELENQVPLIIRKSDEGTLYSTRDLATIKYRMKNSSPEKILYVIGSEQKSYLQQVFSAAEKLGYIKPGQKKNLVHVYFGMISLPEGKMSTRKGRVIFLDHVIKEVTDLAEKTIIIKNPELKNRKRIAQEVGIGAIKYADLSRDRIKDVKFDWDEILSFEGDTGPYIQYTHARACSILRKAKLKRPPAKLNASFLKDAKEKAIVRKLAEFPETVSRAAEDCKPHYIANYVFSLATAFNEFYQSIPVLKAKKCSREARLALVSAVKTTLKNGLFLLGIEAPEEM
ncbi:MAG: arginine--tRNA ligase [Candidatus Aenigmarchaeota archaeon]|nr:arginine--tRNA ligase [Candidatus Aenigmarchaeota archaeon]